MADEQIDGIFSPARDKGSRPFNGRHIQWREGLLVDRQLGALEQRRAGQVVHGAFQFLIACIVPFAQNDATESLPAIRILERLEETREHLLDDGGHARSRAASQNHGRELLHSRAQEHPQDILGHQFLHIRRESIKRSHASQHDHFRSQARSIDRHQERLPDHAGKHAPFRKLPDHPAQAVVQGSRGAGRSHLLENAEDAGPRIHVGDIALHERDIELSLVPATNHQVFEPRRSLWYCLSLGGSLIDRFRRRRHLRQRHPHVPRGQLLAASPFKDALSQLRATQHPGCSPSRRTPLRHDTLRHGPVEDGHHRIAHDAVVRKAAVALLDIVGLHILEPRKVQRNGPVSGSRDFVGEVSIFDPHAGDRVLIHPGDEHKPLVTRSKLGMDRFDGTEQIRARTWTHGRPGRVVIQIDRAELFLPRHHVVQTRER